MKRLFVLQHDKRFENALILIAQLTDLCCKDSK